ncbi:MAG TPA: hypothetical protein VFG04_15745 [Planctomycetaceae bacterium]|nr:hypothetical protein [Planctomycetaceae bacterium]
MNPANIGLAIGATVPVACGVYMFVSELTYRASLPEWPNCALPMLAAWVMMLFVGPVCGVFGAALGWTCGDIYRSRRKPVHSPDNPQHPGMTA